MNSPDHWPVEEAVRLSDDRISEMRIVPNVAVINSEFAPERPYRVSKTSSPNASASQIPLIWNEAILDAIRETRTPPPVAARNLALVSVAMHDAMVSVERQSRPIEVAVRAIPGASVEAAVSQAAYEIAGRLYPALQENFQAVLSQTLASIEDPRARVRGVRLGRKLGESLWNARVDDGSSRPTDFVVSNEAGRWMPTPPRFAPALLPHWANVRPMTRGMRRLRPPGAFPALQSERYAAEFEIVQRMGAVSSGQRTEDQTTVAHFWADGAGTFTPPGHWNQIARTFAERNGIGLRGSVRMFAMLNVALFDAGIACWKCKYETNVWRPVTAIWEAARDGNPLTAADPAWTPLLETPPFPSYVSGHSTFSAAAATVLTRFFGPRAGFEDSGDPAGRFAVRHFRSFHEAAEEAGMSRIYGGIHFPSDNVDGQILGRQVAQLVLARFR